MSLTSNETPAIAVNLGRVVMLIVRALGMKDSVKVDSKLDHPTAGDIYLLCSDGLSGMITDDEIRAILGHGSIEDAVREMVRLANEHGGEDNVTVVVIAVEA